MVGHGGSSAGSYLPDPTSPIPSHCTSIVATSTLRVNRVNVLYFRIKYDLDWRTWHFKFNPTRVQTHNLQIMTVHFMSLTRLLYPVFCPVLEWNLYTKYVCPSLAINGMKYLCKVFCSLFQSNFYIKVFLSIICVNFPHPVILPITVEAVSMYNNKSPLSLITIKQCLADVYHHISALQNTHMFWLFRQWIYCQYFVCYYFQCKGYFFWW